MLQAEPGLYSYMVDINVIMLNRWLSIVNGKHNTQAYLVYKFIFNDTDNNVLITSRVFYKHLRSLAKVFAYRIYIGWIKVETREKVRNKKNNAPPPPPI